MKKEINSPRPWKKKKKIEPTPKIAIPETSKSVAMGKIIIEKNKMRRTT